VEIRIVITKQNKERVLKLIEELVESESEVLASDPSKTEIISTAQSPLRIDLMTEARDTQKMSLAESAIKERKFGSWGMFNSYVPGKAALRVLISMMNKNGGEAVKFWRLVDECASEFWRLRLRYRGFPKRTSDSAKSRLAIQLICPYGEMGLVRIFGEEKDPVVAVTKDGEEFANLRNPLIDDRKGRPLSPEEQKWLLSHLKKIDGLGYKEFTVLKGVTEFLEQGNRGFEDIVNHFQTDKEFEPWVLQGSRHRDSPKAFAQQLHNVSRTFASGKIALLRELGIVSDSRAKYKVIGTMEA
jgi:hypothetical protein